MSWRALVVGLGQIGMSYDLNHDPSRFVLTHARAFQTHPSFQLVGGVDLDPLIRKTFEATYSRPSYGDLVEALSELKPDIVAIATPTAQHYQTVSVVLKNAKPTAILCEKPIAYDWEQALALVSDCDSHNVRLYVNYMRQSDSGVAAIRQRIYSGQIAQPIKGVCWYSKGLFNNGSHFCNLLQHWLGEFTDFQMIAPGRTWQGQDPEPDVSLNFRLGKISFLAAREEDYSHYMIELVSGNGRLRYEQGGAQILWQPVVDHPTCEGYRVLSPMAETIPSDLSRIQWQVVDQLAASLAGREARICDGQNALETLNVLNQIVKSR